MTAGFETRNLYIFPEDRRTISMFDAYRWEQRSIDFADLGLGLSDAAVDDLSRFVKDRLRLLREAEEEGFSELEAGKKALGVLQQLLALQYKHGAVDTVLAPPLESLVRGQSFRLWFIASDAPMESFHGEDYESAKVGSLARNQPTSEIDFATRFDALMGAVREYPVTEGEAGYAAASLPEQAVRNEPLPTDEPLPVLREYVGPGGVGIEGQTVNVDLDGRLGSENPMAVPFLRSESIFLTMYLVWETPVPKEKNRHPVRPAGRPRTVSEKLSAAGFERTRTTELPVTRGGQGPGLWELWTRRNGADTVQYYFGIPGIESGERPLASPFVVAACCGEQSEPAARASLLGELGF